MNETDFVVSNISQNVKALVQVTYSLAENREREIRGLRKAMAATGVRKGIIVTMDEEGEAEYDEGLLLIIRGWRFTINPESYFLS